MSKFVSFLKSVLKIGCIGFGGGTALIPLMEHELIEKEKLDTSDHYNRDVLVASLTPGALPVELACAFGQRNFGYKGALLGASLMALPGALATILFLVVLPTLRDKVGAIMEILTVAVSIFIIFLIVKYIRDVLEKSKAFTPLFYARAIGVMIGVFALTCGKNVYRLLGIEGRPLISLSTFAVLLVALICIFVINVVREARSVKKKNKDMDAVRRHMKHAVRGICSDVIVYILLILVTSIPATILCFSKLDTLPDYWRFVGRGIVSVLTSFGGGDSYLAVADGLFVDNGIVSMDVFYNDIVAVANCVPGSILCKALTAVGYSYGNTLLGTGAAGMAFAVGGFGISVSISCAVLSVINRLYDGLTSFRSIHTIKHYIGPIICGLLGTVSLALLIQCKAAILALMALI